MNSLYDVEITYNKEKYDGYCKKCHELVVKKNNETRLESIIMNSPEMAMFCPPRHLFPTDKCAGSSKWLQYLPGYDDIIAENEEYDFLMEGKVRTAFQQIQNK